MLNSNILGAVARRSILSVMFCASVLLVVCGSAFASTASLGSSQILYYTAATTGETNTVTVSISGSNFVLTDSTATITKETGSCVIGGGGHTLTCPAVYVKAQTVRLYDRNDSYTNNTSTVGGNIYGGTGGDTLNGGYGSASGESLRGEDGNDVLDGRGGYDNVIAGNGDDLVFGRLDGSNLYGGTGSNTLSYANHANPLFASFSLNAVEEAENSEAYDSIDGFNNFVGGSSWDEIFANDGIAGHVECGDGGDYVLKDSFDTIDEDCESFSNE